MRDAGEAAVVLCCGADILDVKDPRRGSLGACRPDTLRAIVSLRDAQAGPGRRRRVVGPDRRRRGAGPARVPVSAALGDAPDRSVTPLLAASLASAGADYLKIGLRGVRPRSEAVAILKAIVLAARSASPTARLVAALFADDDPASSLPLAALPAIAEEAGAAGCLIDTCGKEGRTLLDVAPPETLLSFVAECRRRRLLSALAGSIAAAQLPRLLAIGPDLIGARGALCAGGRQGPIDPVRLASFRDALRGD